jgi:D-aminopeptidase
MAEERRRLRELGITVGHYQTGPLNAITDVKGVSVGHVTLIAGEGPLVPGQGPVRTGVTAILPCNDDIFMERLVAGAFILNGAGEMSGLVQVMEWGLLETPILLTNTLAVGKVSQGVVQYMTDWHPSIGVEHDVIIPLVGECDDSYLNDVQGDHIEIDHVFEAIDSASEGPVQEGTVGGGTGMVSFDLKGGIGTSSRVLPEDEGGYTLGVLVMTNCGRIEDLRVDGAPVGWELAPLLAAMPKRKRIDGSIIVVVGTDAPLTTHQINRLCKRVALGIGRVGSYVAHGSGEIILGFSTANRVPRLRKARTYAMTILSDWCMDPLYQAAIECTEEAILNALCMATTTDGVDGRLVPALPLDELVKVWKRYRPKNH